MKIEMTPKLHPRRGGTVEVGNVYNNPHGKSFYKIVIGMPKENARGKSFFNNVICIHVNTSGEIVGCGALPERYVSEHQDLVGRVISMPSLKIVWLEEKDR